MNMTKNKPTWEDEFAEKIAQAKAEAREECVEVINLKIKQIEKAEFKLLSNRDAKYCTGEEALLISAGCVKEIKVLQEAIEAINNLGNTPTRPTAGIKRGERHRLNIQKAAEKCEHKWIVLDGLVQCVGCRRLKQ